MLAGVSVAGVGLGSGAAVAAPVRSAPHPVLRPAVRCTDSWKTAASGSWSNAAAWSTGQVPATTDGVCITVPGTYTVTLVGNGFAGTLTLGGASGTQTLTVEGNASSLSVLHLSTLTGSDIKRHGVFALDSQDVSGAGYAEVSNDGTTGVTLTNDGTFETLDASVSDDYIDANLTNDSGGDVSIAGANTVEGNSATITNNGTFSITTAGNLSAGGAGTTSFTNSGGTLDNKGTLSVNDVIFTQSGGKLSGNAVMMSDFSTLDDSAGGGSFTLVGDNNVSGTIPTGQTVTVLGTPSSNGTLVLTGDVTNDGTLVLDSQSLSGAGYASLSNAGSPLTLTNNGNFKTIGATVSPDEIAADVTNGSAGTVTVSGASTTGEPSANITNNGSFTVTAKSTFAMTGGSQATTTFTDSGGTLVDKGSMSLNGVVFVQSGGVESGHAVALTDSSTLTDSAGGGSFSMINEDFLSGTIPVGQTITVLGTATSNSTADLTTNVTDDGTLVLDSQNVSGAGYAQYIGGSLTVNGTLKTLGGNVNDNVIGAALTIDSGGLVSISGSHNLANSDNFINNDGGTFAIGDFGNISLTNNAAYNSTPQSTYAVTLDPNDAVYPFIGDANQQGFSGTLKIRVVGNVTVGEGFGLAEGDANTLNENFTAINGGNHTYTVATRAQASQIVATLTQ
jgi:hypothetical protein